MSDLFTRAEALRRIRACRAELVLRGKVRANWRLEVQERTGYAITEDPTTYYRNDGTDLVDCWELGWALKRLPEVRTKNIILDMAFESLGYNGELEDVILFWLGNDETAPMVKIDGEWISVEVK